MTLQTDVVIVGAGPCGIFQIFELGLLGIKAHIVDALPEPGGQCAELYPDKPIYDIPAIPVCNAQELVEKLMEQIKPFDAVFHLESQVTELEVLDDERFRITTSGGEEIETRAVVVAGGVGSFQPMPLRVAGIEAYLDSQV
ncbi:MAG: NAD(P)/FAD-dependent oxidoreductase, partial [Gammaproteobacteria bacterium]|nr:NAD(P)/FAD-dependent oxidoreductase [Gammaproteobacteria bacterium]